MGGPRTRVNRAKITPKKTGLRRAVGGIRLSHLTDETTSPDTQRQLITNEAASDPSRQIEIVAWAEDLDISAADYAPQDRPELGPFLSDPELIDSYDLLIFAKMDRAIRSVIDLHWLLQFCKEHGKELILAKDKLDTSTPMGVAFATLIAAVGEIEIANMVERRRRASEFLRTTSRWPGGPPPFGYFAADNPHGAGKVLFISASHKEILDEIVRRVIDAAGQEDGESLQNIADDLNRRGIPTSRARAKPRQRTNKRKQLEVKGWSSAVLLRMLRSRALLGQKEQQVTDEYGLATGERRLLSDDAGKPILIGPPLMTLERWQELQAVLDANSRPAIKGRAKVPNPLAEVALCSACKCFLTRHAASKRPASTHKVLCYQRNCRKVSAYQDQVWAAATDALLYRIGDKEVMTRVYVKGDSHASDLADVEGRLVALREARYVRGEFDGEEAEWDRLMRQLKERRDALATTVPRRAGWQWKAEGRTYREVWESYGDDLQQKGDLLRKGGITLEIHPAPLGILRMDMHIPTDLLDRLGMR
ncbi:MAG TPA: hypothetical protein DGG94_22065 [Micromonosporaceae bacterium]|nr:hypothetical protein [Micromonosporaceae bacterium]HCU52445.1 hypothetical protein [Micromonosporaceae bacterium]